MGDIQSETKFIFRFIGRLLITPFTLLMVLFGSKSWKDLFEPFRMIKDFVLEAKFVFWVITANIVLFIWSITVPDSVIMGLINYPSDMLGARIFTLITSGFLHADIFHLFGNMLGIFVFGRVVERNLGAIRTGLVYLGALIISGVFSSTIDLILGHNIGGLGASGALMGLVATAMLYEPFYLSYEAILPIPIMVLGWITIYADIAGVINPTESGIGHFAHIGGFLSITLLMFFLGREEREKLTTGLWVNFASMVIALLLFILLV